MALSCAHKVPACIVTEATCIQGATTAPIVTCEHTDGKTPNGPENCACGRDAACDNVTGFYCFAEHSACGKLGTLEEYLCP